MSTKSEEVTFKEVKSKVKSEVKSKEVKSTHESLIFSQVLSPVLKPSLKDFLMDVSSLKKLARKEDSSAQYLLGQTFRFGWHGCVIDEYTGNSYINLAAKNKNTPAGLCAIVICISNALEGTQATLTEQYQEYLKKAIRAKYIPAMWQFASAIIRPKDSSLIVEHGFHATSAYTSATQSRSIIDSSELAYAIELLTIAAEANFVPAIATLSYCYLNGCGVEQNYRKSFELTQQAANAGHAESKFYLGYHYQKGYGIPANESLATQWFKAALDQGYEFARNYVPKPECIIM